MDIYYARVAKKWKESVFSRESTEKKGRRRRDYLEVERREKRKDNTALIYRLYIAYSAEVLEE